MGALAVWVIMEDWDRLYVSAGFIRGPSFPIAMGGTRGLGCTSRLNFPIGLDFPVWISNTESRNVEETPSHM